jgi:hypothetical protein
MVRSLHNRVTQGVNVGCLDVAFIDNEIYVYVKSTRADARLDRFSACHEEDCIHV